MVFQCSEQAYQTHPFPLSGWPFWTTPYRRLARQASQEGNSSISSLGLFRPEVTGNKWKIKWTQKKSYCF